MWWYVPISYKEVIRILESKFQFLQKLWSRGDNRILLWRPLGRRPCLVCHVRVLSLWSVYPSVDPFLSLFSERSPTLASLLLPVSVKKNIKLQSQHIKSLLEIFLSFNQNLLFQLYCLEKIYTFTIYSFFLQVFKHVWYLAETDFSIRKRGFDFWENLLIYTFVS